MTKETILKQQIKAYLNLKQIMWWYNLAGVGSCKGLPDIFILQKGVLYAVEAKTPTGVLSEYQKDFLERAKENGSVVIIARKVEDVMVYI